MFPLCSLLLSLPQLLSSHFPALLVSDIHVPPLYPHELLRHPKTQTGASHPLWVPSPPFRSQPFYKQSLTDRRVYLILEPKTCIGCLRCSDLSSVAVLPWEAVGTSREQGVFCFPESHSSVASAQCHDFNGVWSMSLSVSQPSAPWHEGVANSLHRSPV